MKSIFSPYVGTVVQVCYFNLRTQGLIPGHVCETIMPTPLNHEYLSNFKFLIIENTEHHPTFEVKSQDFDGHSRSPQTNPELAPTQHPYDKAPPGPPQ